MFTLILTACLAGMECASEDLGMFIAGPNSKEFCETAKEAFEEKYLPRLKPEDRASFKCKGFGER